MSAPKLPPLPPGAKLDEPAATPALPPLPPGAKLDGPSIPAAPSSGSATGAAGLGFGQGASFGFTDELSGMVSGLLNGFTRAGLQATKNPVARAAIRQMLGRDDLPDVAIDDIMEKAAARSVYEVTGAGGPSEPRIPSNPDNAYSQAYARTRDDYRRDLDRAQAENPKAYLAGEVAGAIAAPGPKGARGATGVARAGQLARQGAAYGAGAALGYSKAPVGSGQQVAETALGAATGGVAAPAVAIGADKAARGLRNLSRDQALKAMGLRAGISSQLEKRGYETVDEARELGQAALDMDLIRPFRSASDVAERAGFAKEAQGARISQALADADAVGPFDTERASWQAAGEVMGPQGLSPRAIDESGKAQRIVENIRELASAQEPTFANANRLKSDIYSGINYANDPKLRTSMERRAASGLRKSIEDQVAERAGPDAADELRAANRQYGLLQDIQPLAREEANRQLERKSVLDPSTLGWMLAGGGVGTAGAGPAGGAVGSALPFIGKALSPYAPSAYAVGAQSLSRVAPKAVPSLARPTTQQLTQEEEDAIAAFLSGG